MRRLALALLPAAAVAACSQPAGPEIAEPWTRATAGGASTAAVFMTIRSDSADRLTDASTPAAGKTDLMTMKSEGGAMAMEYLDAIPIPAGESVSLDPSGLHVWLADLKEPLKAGQTFPLILEFEKAGEQRVDVTVVAPAAAAPMPGMEM